MVYFVTKRHHGSSWYLIFYSRETYTIFVSPNLDIYTCFNPFWAAWCWLYKIVSNNYSTITILHLHMILFYNYYLYFVYFLEKTEKISNKCKHLVNYCRKSDEWMHSGEMCKPDGNNISKLKYRKVSATTYMQRKVKVEHGYSTHLYLYT